MLTDWIQQAKGFNLIKIIKINAKTRIEDIKRLKNMHQKIKKVEF
jgi:hypothetical protein